MFLWLNRRTFPIYVITENKEISGYAVQFDFTEREFKPLIEGIAINRQQTAVSNRRTWSPAEQSGVKPALTLIICYSSLKSKGTPPFYNFAGFFYGKVNAKNETALDFFPRLFMYR